jgi:hypothetical protein
VEIVPQSASVTIEIEQVDMPSVTGRWDLEGLPPRPKGRDEPLDRGARPAIADLSPGAITDGAASAAPVRERPSGHRSHR